MTATITQLEAQTDEHGATVGSRSRAVLTVEEAAIRVGVGRTLAYQLVRSGQLPGVRLGRRWVIPVVALERFLTSATNHHAE